MLKGPGRRHTGALAIDQLGGGPGANQIHGMSREQQLSRKQRAVGRAEDQETMRDVHVSECIFQEGWL